MANGELELDGRVVTTHICKARDSFAAHDNLLEVSSGTLFDGKPAEQKSALHEQRSSHQNTPTILATGTDSPDRHPQIQSPLFHLLPDELRLMIYSQVLGNQVLHIIRRHQKLGHTLCKNPDGSFDACREAQCRGRKMPTGEHEATVSSPGHGGMIQLLQTCRRIYTESAPLLYTLPTLSFDSPETLLAYASSLPAHHVPSIRHVQLDLRFHLSFWFGESTPISDFATWETLWRTVAGMQGLRDLEVRITWPRIPSMVGKEEEEERWLEPLELVGRGVERFEVSLPPGKGGDGDRDGEVRTVGRRGYWLKRREIC